MFKIVELAINQCSIERMANENYNYDNFVRPIFL